MGASMGKSPRTVRGQAAIENALRAASRLLEESWVTEVSLSRVASEANLTRSSLMLQFQDGWQDLASTLMYEWLDKVDRELSELGTSPDPKVVADFFAAKIEEAGQRGRLFGNLRGLMFACDPESAPAFGTRVVLRDIQESLVGILLKWGVGYGHADAVADSLINHWLDLVAGLSIDIEGAADRCENMRRVVREIADRSPRG